MRLKERLIAELAVSRCTWAAGTYLKRLVRVMKWQNRWQQFELDSTYNTGRTPLIPDHTPDEFYDELDAAYAAWEAAYAQVPDRVRCKADKPARDKRDPRYQPN